MIMVLKLSFPECKYVCNMYIILHVFQMTSYYVLFSIAEHRSETKSDWKSVYRINDKVIYMYLCTFMTMYMYIHVYAYMSSICTFTNQLCIYMFCILLIIYIYIHVHVFYKLCTFTTDYVHVIHVLYLQCTTCTE